MAVVGEITESYSTDQFLKGSETDGLVETIESGNISKLEEDFKNKIFDEEKKGLSLEALSIDGRAPLNELALELRTRIDVSIEDVENLKTIAKAKGYKHTKDEAEKFLKEVLKKYKELCEAVDRALRDCENASYDDEYTEDGEKKTKKVYCKNTITVKYEISGLNTTKITKSGKKDSDSHFNDVYEKFEDAFEKAEKYYDDKVEKAIEFKKEADKLAVPSTAGIAMPISNEESRPEGVQPDAKKEDHVNQNGDGYVLYTNPDGSTVKIKYEKGKITDHKVINKYGYTTETVKYGEDGKVAYKNVWTYHKVEGTDHVYTSEYQKYVPGDNDEWVAEGEPVAYGYSYPDSDGNIRNIKGDTPPSDDEVGEPKAAHGSMYYEHSHTSDSDSDTDTEVTELTGNNEEVTTGPKTVTPASIRETIENKEDFILPKGSTIIDDRSGLSNRRFHYEDEDVYFEYDEDDNVYYPKNSNGNYIDPLGIEVEKSKLKEQKDYLDIDNYLKGEGAPLYSTEFIFSNNSRSDIKIEK